MNYHCVVDWEAYIQSVRPDRQREWIGSNEQQMLESSVSESLDGSQGGPLSSPYVINFVRVMNLILNEGLKLETFVFDSYYGLLLLSL